MSRKLSAALVALPFLAAGAFAAGSDSATPPEPTETSTKCPDGEIYDADKKACEKSASLNFDDDDRYEAVRELAYTGRSESALAVIASADAPESPRFLTYRGFTLRQMGDTAGAMTAYRKALALDPGNNLARSYMAQGLLKEGRRTEAVAQLHEIEARAGHGSWAHRSLMLALRGEHTTY
ncbi:hypothetical protein OB2597_09824 [Pseudooceanicola batsensis HTCC2597]|uniref:Uncharacterized protein n=1 Tax=Pseudooceanicola batsensis (strain ATCC BAA-863 / DSM 15984 / KCTC 12145 / HTCC2597) TaxID=252305 RepID=A3TV87_PSEBH|nr:tetratricopeptide repeat protein [Pseudooceanicola batsensis]EAQ04433.1 hypothetical protein OB2597_09824 [Pseudooceanicola batsensis HTCC2597]